MSGALKNIIQRHLQAPKVVQPRLPGIFEQGGTERPDVSAFFSETTETSTGYTAAPTLVFQPEFTRKRQEISGFHPETAAREPLTPDEIFSKNTPSELPLVHEPRPIDPQEKAGTTIRAHKQENPDAPKATAFTMPINVDNGAGDSWSHDKPPADFQARIRYIKMISGQNPQPADTGGWFPLAPRTFERVEKWRQQPLSPAQNAREKTEAPSINITIGSIEIRAVKTPPPARNTTQAPKPAMSLEQYINERKG